MGFFILIERRANLIYIAWLSITIDKRFKLVEISVSKCHVQYEINESLSYGKQVGLASLARLPAHFLIQTYQIIEQSDLVQPFLSVHFNEN